jgi:hypothetical protein
MLLKVDVRVAVGVTDIDRLQVVENQIVKNGEEKEGKKYSYKKQKQIVFINRTKD